jgi:hypothetical protein
MPDTVTTALIGAGATLIGAAVPELIKASVGRKRFRASPRAYAIAGPWLGTGDDFYVEGGKPAQPFELRVTFQKRGRKFEGKGELLGLPEKTSKASVLLEGGFFSEDYVQFTYRSKDPYRKQMGVIVFRLSGDARTLSGHYAGISPGREAFVVGTVSLTRLMPAEDGE